MIGHVTVEEGMRRSMESDSYLEALVTRLPPLGPAGKMAGRPIPGLDYLDLDLHPTRWHLVESWRGRRALVRHLAKFDADVVHVNSHTAAFLCAEMMRQRPFMLSVDVPVWAWHEMGIWRPVWPHSRRTLWLSEQLERRAFGNAAMVLAYSEWAARLIRHRCPSARVRIWHPGVDASRFSPATRQAAESRTKPYRLLFVGARFDAKGGHDLISAVGPRLGRDIELDIVTPDQVAARPGLRVHRLSGDAPELVELYRAADLLCLPTRGDASPWVVLEAMSCGVPVLSTNVGAIPDTLRAGTADEAGIVVNPGAVNNLTGALDDLLKDPVRRRRMGEAGRQEVYTRHSTEVQAKRFVSLLDEALS